MEGFIYRDGIRDEHWIFGGRVVYCASHIFQTTAASFLLSPALHLDFSLSNLPTCLPTCLPTYPHLYLQNSPIPSIAIYSLYCIALPTYTSHQAAHRQRKKEKLALHMRHKYDEDIYIHIHTYLSINKCTKTIVYSSL